jgi:ribulose-phosphate 3-epimerase
MRTIKLSCSILSADFSNLERSIHEAEDGGVDWIHVDVMDGHFVPNLTMGPFIVEACRKITPLPLDVHLMIEKPEQLVGQFVDAGANYLTLHIEGNPNISRTLDHIRSLGVHPSVALNPGTPIAALEAAVDYADMALIMSVNPGFSGQTYYPNAPKRIKELADLARSKNKELIIEVDGGISSETIKECCDAGATAFVAATAIFKNPLGIAAGIQSLRQSSC